MRVCLRRSAIARTSFANTRLLEPGEVAILDRAAEQLCVDRRKFIVGIQHQLDVGPDRLADGADAFCILGPAVLVDADHHLQARHAAFDLDQSGFDQLLAIVHRKAECHVSRRPVARAAEKLRHRAARGFAFDIPAGDVQRRQREGHDAGEGAHVQRPPDFLVDRLGVARIHAFHGVEEVIFERRHHRPGQELAAG